LEARVKQAGHVLTFEGGPTRDAADTALMMAHMLAINLCELVHQHFAPHGLKEPLVKAIDDYGIIWELEAKKAAL
jgi:hypothetical protein